jgi:hypothetical protein
MNVRSRRVAAMNEDAVARSATHRRLQTETASVRPADACASASLLLSGLLLLSRP